MTAVMQDPRGFRYDRAVIRKGMNAGEGARREGRLVWYAGPNPMTKILADRFRRDHPGIALEIVALDGPVMGERFLSEKRISCEIADVLSGGAGQCFPLFRRRGYLASLSDLPSWRSHPEWAKDPGGFSFSYMNMKTVLMYNAHMISERLAPRSYADFLDLRWRGRVVAVHPSSRGWGLQFFRFAAAHPSLGKAWIRRFGDLEPLLLYMAGGVLTQTIVEGGRPLGFGRDLEAVFARKAGEAIGMRPMKEGFLLQFMPSGVNAKAPHPNAARLFADWLMSEETRDFISSQGFGYPMRGDLRRAREDGAYIPGPDDWSYAKTRRFVNEMAKLLTRRRYVPSIPPKVSF